MLIESLLRTTSVERIYVLLRPKRGQDTAARASGLLKAPLFHLVRQRPDLVAKVVAISGDISVPGLGLSPEDLATLEREVNFIIHSAADIRLEPPMQETLRSNYLGTKRVLQLAARCLHGAAARAARAGQPAPTTPPALKCVVHVSTCYTNIEQPRGSTVAERLYPLRYGEQLADAEALAEELLALPSLVAEERAATLMARWNFPNSYCLGKRLTELMAARLQAQHHLPMAIVRPSLVGSLAGAPLPGYTGNWAGPAGMGAALAIGIHPHYKACSSSAISVWDVVPGDVCTSGVLAAAAAVAQGLAPALRAATGCGSWDLPNTGPIWTAGAAGALAALAAADDEFARVAAVSGGAAGGAVRAATPLQGSAGGGSSGSSADATIAIVPAGVGADHEASEKPMGNRLARAFGRSSSKSGGGGGSFGGFGGGAAPSTPPSIVAPASPHHHHAPAPATSLNQYAANLARQPCPPLVIVHSASSTIYPAYFTEGWNIALDFFDAFPPKHRIAFSSLSSEPRLGPTFVADMRAVESAKFWSGMRIRMVGALLRAFGQGKAADKLVTGHMQWAQNNDLKTDRDLFFRTDALRALDAALRTSERRDYLVVWRPAIPNRPPLVLPGEETAAIAARLAPNGAFGEAAGSAVELSSSLPKPAMAGADDPVGQDLQLDGEEEQSVGRGAPPALHPADGMGWVRYGYSNLAGLYHMMYGKTPSAPECGTGKTRDGRDVPHSFRMPARPTEGQGGVATGLSPGSTPESSPAALKKRA
jgi:nucleoside-diphosphate-sugar epimerase